MTLWVLRALVAAVSLWALWAFVGEDLWARRQQSAALWAADDPTMHLPAAPTPAAPPPGAPTPGAPAQLGPVPEPASALPPDGTPVGQIIIPKIGLDVAIVTGTEAASLAAGPGVWRHGVVPGSPGNATISGHRTTFGAPFRHIDQLVPGDRVTVTLPGREPSVYEVRGSAVVAPTDVAVTEQTDGVRLTLTTCHPVGSAAERLIVQAELVEGPNVAAALPADRWLFHQ